MARTLARKRNDVNMTEGSTFRHLLYFALPLLAGNLFQQLYNTVDTWVVGNYVSNEAFSAVGSVAPIINTLIGFFTGLASGAGVVISQYYGAGQEERVRDTVHTAATVTLILCVVFTLLGNWMTPYFLRFMKTPVEVFPESTTYLRIYFNGISGLLVYNMGAAILRAVGDSTRPFYFLVATALINTVLDLLFVIGFGMGVDGVALATIIAQGISALLIVIAMCRSRSCVSLSFRRLRMHFDILGKIVKIGIPTALQMALVSFSNVFVQSYINYFGADCMSGWTVYHKLDQLVMLPIQSLSMACTTFVGQNLGNDNMKRAQKGVATAMLMALSTTVFLSAVIIGFAPKLVVIFNSKPEVVEYGILFLRKITPLYVVPCAHQILMAAQRGAGNSRVNMLIAIGSFVFFRQIYLYVMANFISNTVLPIVFSYPAGWIVSCSLSAIYFKKVGLRSTSRIVEKR